MFKKIFLIPLIILVCAPLIVFAWSFDYTSTGTTDTVSGVRGDGLRFDAAGTANYITFTDSGDYLPTNFAVSFWYKSATQESNKGIMQKGNMAADYDFALIKNGSTWTFRCGGTSCPSAADYDFTGYDDDAWHHIVLSISQTFMKVYVDGTYVAPSSGDGSTGGSLTLRSDQDIVFGTYHSAPGIESTFDLDEVAIFESHLSEASVATYYNSGNGGFPNGDNCLVYANDFNGGNGGGSYSGCTVPSAPTVTTQAASSVTQTTATLNGNITVSGNADATQKGFAYGTSATLATVIATTTEGSQSGTGAFTSSITSLTCNTTYYARAYATNSEGTGYGSIETFTTAVCTAPAITTSAASSITQTTATLNANITDLGGNNATQKGFAYGTSATLATVIATTTLGTQSAVGTFSGGITSLTCNTTYYVRAYATNTTGTGYGSIASFTTTACIPSVTTSAVSSITQTTATLNADITATGGANATQKGFAYGTTPTLIAGIATSTLGAQSGTGAFSGGVTSLTCNTTYYARGYATNTGGTGYGSIVSFTTSACVPTVTSQAASSVADTTTTLNGTITVTGGASPTVRGFVYGLTTAYGATTTENGSFSTGAFTSDLSSLTCNSTYHFSTYAVNTSGTSTYPADGTFTTSACTPSVSTSAVSSITQTTATLNADITATGGADATEKGFAYGTSATLSTVIATTTEGSQSGTGAFTSSVTSLTCNTTYYARGYATNSGGTGYGSIETLTTTACAVAATEETAPSSSSGGSRRSSFATAPYLYPQDTAPTIVDGVFDSVVSFVKPIFKGNKMEYTSPEEPISEPVPEPLVYTEDWTLFNPQRIDGLVFNPLPDELILLAKKFPKLDSILVSVGVKKASDIEKLRYSSITLPPLSSVSEVPAEVIFAQAGEGSVDLPSTVLVTESGVVEQKVTTVSGSRLTLSVKPQGAVHGVSGYLAFTSRQEKTVIETPLDSSLASALFGYFAFAQESPAVEEIDKKFIVQRFEYTDTDGDGLYTAEIQTPVVEGEYEVVTIIKYTDPKKGTRETHLITLIDPEGCVFESNGGNETRLPEVEVTIWRDTSDTTTLWNAGDYNQKNPQVTDKTGRYSFLVPPGKYYITATGKGFEPYQGDQFTVSEGGGVHTNIELRRQHSFVEYVGDWKSILLVVLIGALVVNFVNDRRLRRSINKK